MNPIGELKKNIKTDQRKIWALLLYRLLTSTYKYFLTKSKKIEHLALQTQLKCNSRCRYCLIWKLKDQPELSITEIEKIFRSKALKNLKTLAIQGGEPSLRKDLDRIAAIAAQHIPGIVISIDTNGLLPQKIYRDALSITKNDIPINICISLNGPREIHDWSRGVKGNYDKIMETIELLKSIKTEKLTISLHGFYFPRSIENIPWLAEFARKKGIRATLSRVVIMERSYNKHMKKEIEDPKMFSKELATILTNEFAKGTVNIWEAYYQEKCINREKIKWVCPRHKLQNIRIDQEGNVYPCNISNPELCLGSTKNQTLDQILNSHRAKQVRKTIQKREGPCKTCTDSCMIRNSLFLHPHNVLDVLIWYLRKNNKPIIEHKSEQNARTPHSLQ